MKRQVVANVAELSVGSRKIVKINNFEIGVFNIDNHFYALKSICPHQGASLCQGVVTGTNLPSKVSQYQYGRDGEILRCPWHNWEFDIRTGISLCDDSVRVATYRCVVEGEEVIVYI